MYIIVYQHTIKNKKRNKNKKVVQAGSEIER